jgi:monoterpene epsilon-lactone hydrolase
MGAESTGAQSATSDGSADGTTTIGPYELPPSRFMSPESQATLPQVIGAYKRASPDQVVKDAIADDVSESAGVLAMEKEYPVSIREQYVGGVRTRIVEPAGGVPPENKKLVLLNVHEGGFFVGANALALIDSIPIAATSKIRVITIDYREGPNHRYPEGTDDVVSVYRVVLQTTRSRNIGMFGCSSGGSLTAMVAARLQTEGLPQLGAIGILSAGAFADWSGDPQQKGTWGGDSAYSAAAAGLTGLPVPSVHNFVRSVPAIAAKYLQDVDVTAPEASPAEWPHKLAQFPPSLILTGTRSFDMSAAIETHRRLINAGVDAELHVWDGMWHCFTADATLPESREAYSVIGKFFHKHLGRGRSVPNKR